MTQEEHQRWEEYWRESAQRDFERQIYRRCEQEDALASAHEVGDEGATK